MAPTPYEMAADNDPLFEHYPMEAGAVIEHGHMVALAADGFAKLLVGTDADFAGIAEESKDNTGGADGAKRIRVRRNASIYLSVGEGSAALDALTIADHGATLYATTHLRASITNSSTNALAIGKLVGKDANSKWVIKVEALALRSL